MVLAADTRASTLSAVVVRFSRTRKRYERQGILAEPKAIERAETESFRHTVEGLRFGVFHFSE